MLKLLISFFLGEATCQPASAPSYNERIRPSTMTLEAVSQVRQKKRVCPREYTQMLVFVFAKKGRRLVDPTAEKDVFRFFASP